MLSNNDLIFVAWIAVQYEQDKILFTQRAVAVISWFSLNLSIKSELSIPAGLDLPKKVFNQRQRA